MRRLLALGLATMLAIGVAAPVGAVPAPPPNPFTPPIALLIGNLTGAAERPGPGDPDGVGTAIVMVNRLTNDVCYWVSVMNIVLPAIGNHIHIAPPTAPGPIVIPLENPGESGFVSGCLFVPNSALIANLAENPSQYYLNVHNAIYPGGAVRGQLFNPAAPGT